MADEVLHSLMMELDGILGHQNSSCFRNVNGGRRCRNCFILQKNLPLHSLRKSIIFLSHFLNDFRGETANVERRLTIAARQARDAFFSVENDIKWNEIRQELEKSIENIGSLHKEAKRIKSCSKDRLGPVMGLDEGLIEMKGRLYGEPPQLQIISIVGMGGIGKTTLARYTFQDTLTTNHFDVHAWATVSQYSSGKMILSSLLSSIDPSNKTKYKRMDKESLVVHGHRYLKNRRYLIVMDDMWDTNVWDDVRMAFPDDCNGSRVIITTRNLDVASYVDISNNPHKIQLMSVDQSWRLLKERVFELQNCPPELEKIGKHIAEKCKGLPLAIVVTAGVLSMLEQKLDSWEKIARNVPKAVNTSGDEQFYDILSLSYTHLPPCLRPCFLYIACFPEDYEIDVSRLIGLWVAEGFLISDESKDMEELGYEYLEDLARRSLILIDKQSYDGKIKAIKIHDVLRDLCIRKSQDENFLCVINKFKGCFPQGIENSHRLSICSNVWGCIPNKDCTPIHTIMILAGHWAFAYWKHFRYLKVLDAMALELEPTDAFAFEITQLIHLRYLALSFGIHSKRFSTTFPESVSNLINLKTFIMRVRGRYMYHVRLPVEVWRMLQLRHTILPNAILPDPSTYDCQEALPLGNLHTLWRIKNFRCSATILKMLPNLKKLGIRYLDWSLNKTGWSKYGLKNLVHLACLEKLSIHVYNSYKKGDAAQNLAFPVKLKRLTLSGCVISWDEMGIIGSLPNLEVLKLKRNINGGTIWETTEGGFCQLKVLRIESTDLHHWITGSSHFPSLERLTLYECNNLQEIPCDIGEISTVQMIEVDGRNLPIVQSAKGIQEEQQNFGNDLQVRLLTQQWKW